MKLMIINHILNLKLQILFWRRKDMIIMINAEIKSYLLSMNRNQKDKGKSNGVLVFRGCRSAVADDLHGKIQNTKVKTPNYKV